MPTQAPTTDQIREAWDAIASGFDEFVHPKSVQLGEDALSRVDIRPGMRFLDVAAGAGALSIPAARRGAQVVATDIAPTMIERLNARARADELSNLEGVVMNGEALDLDDDTFDVAGSQNGVSLFPDLEAGLNELVRVTRPGGRVLIVAFGTPQKAEFLTFFLAAMRVAVPGFTPPPMDPPPLPFQLADPATFHRKLIGAGLVDVKVESVTWAMPFESVAHFWDLFISSNPIGGQLIANLTDEQAQAVRQVIDGMLRDRSGGEPGAVLHAEANIGVGTKSTVKTTSGNTKGEIPCP